MALNDNYDGCIIVANIVEKKNNNAQVGTVIPERKSEYYHGQDNEHLRDFSMIKRGGSHFGKRY